MKIRGFRIEPGEIEAVLAAHPAVAQAAVVAREDAPGETGGWSPTWCPAGAGEPTAGCRARPRGSFAAGRLPEYMVPAAVVVLDALPLTANGKLDRRALPAPDSRPAAGAGGGARRPRARRSCAGRSPRCSACRRSGVDDDFFDLGGHSLLATRLVSRVRAVLGAGGAGAGAVRGADGGRAGRRGWTRRGRRRGRRWPRGRGRSGCRCRSRSSGCGSSTSWRARARPTTSRSRCGCPGELDAGGAAARRCATWSAGTRCCARCSRRPTGEPYQQVLAAGELDWRLPVTSTVAAGGAATRAVAGGGGARRSTWRAEIAAAGVAVRAAAPGEHVLVLVVHHIAGDGWSMGAAGAGPVGRVRGAAARARRRSGSRCRCSTPTTRCGSASCSATRTTRTACWPRQVAYWRRGAGRGAGGAGAAGRPAAPGGGQPPRATGAADVPGRRARAAARRWPAARA